MALFRDRIELEAKRLEPVPTAPADLPICYPYPSLRATDDVRSISLDTVGFDSEHLSVVVCPDLGGRIVSLHDRRSDADLISLPSQLNYEIGGSRGVVAAHGIELVSEGGRPLAMAPLQHSVQELDEGEGSCFVYDPLIQTEVSLQIGYGFGDEQRSVNLEALVVHRGSHPKRVPLAMMIHGAKEARLVNSRLASVEIGGGCIAIESQMPLYGAEIAGNAALVQILPFDMALMPAEAVTRRLKITPLGGMKRLIGLESDVAIGAADGQLVLRSLKRVCDGVLYIQTQAGETLEAPIEFSPGSDWLGDIGSVAGGVARLRMVLSDGTQFEVEFEPKIHLPQIGPGRMWASNWVSNEDGTGGSDPRVLGVFGVIEEPGSASLPDIDEDDPILGSSSLLAQTLGCVARGELEAASAAAESLLTREAQSPINWWLAATISRERGIQDEESDPLLNAHFLSPLEPMLKVEAFLRTPVSSDAQRTTILESLAKDPEASVDAALRLYSWGFKEASVRVIEDFNRVKPSAYLYLLLAGIYLGSERFAFEADRLVKLADKLSVEPPFPHSTIAWRLLKKVENEFPDSENAKTLFSLAEAFVKKGQPASKEAGE